MDAAVQACLSIASTFLEPPEEGADFVSLCNASGLSYVPLLTPTSTNDRIAALAKTATSFLYCVSLTGVTGARAELPSDLPDFLNRIREQTSLPLAEGATIERVPAKANLRPRDDASSGESAPTWPTFFLSPRRMKAPNSPDCR